jgi:hypothetical protein
MSNKMLHILRDPPTLINYVRSRLNERHVGDFVFSPNKMDLITASAVLFLLGERQSKDGVSLGPCLILNKRSMQVRQPGDLCCPGGSVTPRLDSFLATLLRLPIFPLVRWPYWPRWRKRRPQEAKLLRLLFATSLRESVEEMRINPFRLKFLGPLPPQSLLMFGRVIYPMAVWISGQKRFYLNWEVEKVVSIPLRDLLNPDRYARCRLRIKKQSEPDPLSAQNDYPCFCYDPEHQTELLWGATYRIATAFLEHIFGFVPPDYQSLPVIRGRLNENYLTGI